MENSRTDRSRYRWLVISVAFIAFMSKLDLCIVNMSLPTIANHFNVGTGQVSRVVLAYLLGSTSTLLLFGRLGDRYGLKRIFLLGYAVFIFGSFLCGTSPSLAMLIPARFIQGIGCAMLVAMSFAIIPRVLPPEITGWAFGISATGAALGIAAGAPLGGIITGYLSWNWVFLINVPVAVLAALMARWVIPEVRTAELDRRNGTGFDITGALLSFLGLSLLVYALNGGQQAGWTAGRIIGALVLAGILFAGFFIREKTYRAPLFDFTLFKNARFAYAHLATIFAYMFLAGNVFLLPFYLEVVKGLGPVRSGFIIMTYSVVTIVVAPYAGCLSDRIKPSLICAVAMLSSLLCALCFAFTLELPGLIPVLVLLVWLAASYGMYIPSNNHQVMSLAPEDRQGMVSGTFGTINNLGLALGICIFETVMSSAMPHQEVAPAAHVAANPASSILFFRGMRNAYIAGAIVSLLAMVFSLVGRGVRKPAV
jgi:EmrB/QacA subfamily drug resistance transporter